MNRLSTAAVFGLATIVVLGLVGPAAAVELQRPSKIVLTPLDNLLVAEVGTATNNSSRVSIVDRDGNRRTLIEGLPSAVNAANSPSGASGLCLEGRTLYLVIGEGDVTKPGPLPRTEIPNPTPASPLFSCVLAVHFSAAAEKTTTGIALTLQDHRALKAGEKLVRKDARGQKITVELVVDFPDYVAEPLPNLATNVRHVHPYGVAADEEFLYVIDAGLNAVHMVEIDTGLYETIVYFSRTPNPTPVGPPLIEKVPTSIHWDGDHLLVTLLSGFPFIAGLSEMVEIDPVSGELVTVITGLASAIDVIPIHEDGETVGYLTLEYSLAHLAGGPGRLQVFDAWGNSISVIDDELITPSCMIYDRKTGCVIVAEINTGKLVSISLFNE